MKNRNEMQIDQSRKLTRREMLGVILSAGTFLLFPRMLFSQIAYVGSQQDRKGESVYSVTTETKDGILIHATAEPYRLAFSVKGPIKPGRGVPLFVTRDVIAEKMKEPQQTKEAADKLRAVSESFIEPRMVEIKDRSVDYGMVDVRFMFLGEENPSRRIKVIVTLKDDKNRMLHNASEICSDQRIYAKNHDGGRTGGGRRLLSMANYVPIKYDIAIEKSIRGIEVIFEEVR